MRSTKTCTLDGCDRAYSAKGYCAVHYNRAKKGKPLDAPIRAWNRNRGTCPVDECGKPATHKGCCQVHYQLGRNGGNWRFRALRRHNMTAERYAAMLDSQGGGCAMCGGPNQNGRELCVDHDHSCCPTKDRSCGKCVRGLLCHSCNFKVGHLEAMLNGEDWVLRALKYLGVSDE
ncbi:endonuclease VII [Mycobacterium phage Wamburgrxpress]|uniref:Endonuclease VII n=1 Tax=Mycobacterium phage Wamburgrxpress TaxID=2315617 RepID=A0A386KB12_9CAUD|nr:endonuclease VII [Mycobacterium phage Wamburgrxpress]WMI34662.1 endonuclease VII [Mycobacterium phage Calm]